jgi:hypothetical protein
MPGHDEDMNPFSPAKSGAREKVVGSSEHFLVRIL